MRTRARELTTARPSMAAVANTVARVCAAGWPPGAPPRPDDETDRVRAALTSLRDEAERLATGWDSAAAAIATHARPLAGARVFTHSRSGTVERVLTARAQPALQAVVVTESRPGGEGVAAAQALAATGLTVTLVADSAVGLFAHEADAVVLGADSVRADGSLVNKIGSFPLALAARAAGIPVYVLCETLKIAPEGWPLILEEMDAAELLPDPIPGVTARNVYFDHTPAAYITAIITETGALAPDAVRPLARAAGDNLASLRAE